MQISQLEGMHVWQGEYVCLCVCGTNCLQICKKVWQHMYVSTLFWCAYIKM